jgi:TetR/AcrR family transcriptional regulator of autoinduction and epiphytic fitness
MAAAGEKRTDRKRAAILAAATRAFCDEGYHVTSMDRISERAGASKRTVYNHFASKDELFDAVIAGFWARLAPTAGKASATAARKKPAVSHGRSGGTTAMRARLEAFAHARLDILLEPELLALCRVVIAESVRAPALRRAYGAAHDFAGMIGIRELIADEVAGGGLRADDLDVAAVHYWDLVLGGAFWSAVIGLQPVVSADERARVVAANVRAFLHGYAAGEAPPPRRRAHPRVGAART